MDEAPSGEPYVSIIVPVRNASQTIRDLLDSLMKLEYDRERLEIIVVDGRSTDGTKKIVSEYPVLLIDEEGVGLNAARNTGIRHSTGEIVAYTDSDCVVPPNWVKTLARNFRDPDISFVGGLVEGLDKADFLSVYLDETFFPVKPGFQGRQVTTDLDLLRFPAGCNMAFRRNALEKIDFFDERIDYGFDDLDPVEKLGSRGFRIVLDPDVRVWHRHRTTLKEILKQHFNYGRGGALMIVYKRISKLARWFTTYLIASTLTVSMMVMMLVSSYVYHSWFLFGFMMWLMALVFIFLMSLNIEPAFRTKKVHKLLLYPALDIIRGVFFTLGGLTQLIRMALGERRTPETLKKG